MLANITFRLLPPPQESLQYQSPSILKNTSVQDLTNKNVFLEVLQEMKRRCPELLQLMTDAAIDKYSSLTVTMRQIMSIVTSYSVLMFARCNRNSAIQRMITLLAVKGNASDELIKQLNQISVTVSCTQKIYILDKAVETSERLTVNSIKSNPAVKITGDNLDMFVRTNHQRVDNGNQDIHWFASNLVISRIDQSGLSQEIPKVQYQDINPAMFVPSEAERKHLIDVKKALIGRLLTEKKDFQWLKGLLPKQIPHRFSEMMKKKSEVYSLPVFFQNESKNEDCLKILKQYETHLIKIFMEAHGNLDQLNSQGVVLGGDQLTRERLQNMKNICHLAITPEGKFQHLHPIVCEWWHMKQDLLAKAYKALYKTESLEQRGTLFHCKIILRRADVTGNVKSNYKAHEQLLLLVVQALIHVASESIEDPENMGRDYVLTDIYKRINGEMYGNDDHLLNYCTNLLTWGLQIINLNDTAKEGDIDRLVMNAKENIPFFYGHSKFSKYFAESVNTILQTEYLLSPMLRMRMLEGAFLNLKGRPGQNKEADLVQENCIKNKKELIRSLGANKTERAVQRACGAADTCFAVSENFSRQIGLGTLSGHHTKKSSSKDLQILVKTFRELEPFTYHSGRQLKNFEALPKDPRSMVSQKEIIEAIKRKTRSLFIYK